MNAGRGQCNDDIAFLHGLVVNDYNREIYPEVTEDVVAAALEAK